MNNYKGSIILPSGLGRMNEGYFLANTDQIQAGEDGTSLTEKLKNLPTSGGGSSNVCFIQAGLEVGDTITGDIVDLVKALDDFEGGNASVERYGVIKDFLYGSSINTIYFVANSANIIVKPAFLLDENYFKMSDKLSELSSEAVAIVEISFVKPNYNEIDERAAPVERNSDFFGFNPYTLIYIYDTKEILASSFGSMFMKSDRNLITTDNLMDYVKQITKYTLPSNEAIVDSDSQTVTIKNNNEYTSIALESPTFHGFEDTNPYLLNRADIETPICFASQLEMVPAVFGTLYSGEDYSGAYFVVKYIMVNGVTFLYVKKPIMIPIEHGSIDLSPILDTPIEYSTKPVLGYGSSDDSSKETVTYSAGEGIEISDQNEIALDSFYKQNIDTALSDAANALQLAEGFDSKLEVVGETVSGHGTVLAGFELRIKDLEGKPDKDTTYTAGKGVSISEANEISVNVSDLELPETYDDSALKARIKELEDKPDKDTVYDDTDVKKRLSDLEAKTDKDTTYSAGTAISISATNEISVDRDALNIPDITKNTNAIAGHTTDIANLQKAVTEQTDLIAKYEATLDWIINEYDPSIESEVGNG